MKLVSVNVGLPREIVWKGMTITTGIYKTPVRGRVPLRKLNLDGDAQADLNVHGGIYKAVYAYPVEHYDYWRAELPEAELPFGMFGENLTVQGLLEREIHIGDCLRMGTAELVVTQPRLPCYKLAAKFQSDDMVRRFLASRRVGFYCSVAREGEVGAGDDIEVLAREPHRVSITEIVHLYLVKKYGPAEDRAARRATQVQALPEGWRSHLLARLKKSAP